MSGSWPTWDEWIDQLDDERRQRAEVLRAEFERLGADKPDQWTMSEIEEGIPQLARFVFLRTAWEGIEQWRDREAIERQLPDASDDAIDAAHAVARRAAFQVAWHFLVTLEQAILPLGDDLPGWILYETNTDLQATGRIVSGLHESLLETDPRGIEAEDIRG